jgi:hypothetical protein
MVRTKDANDGIKLQTLIFEAQKTCRVNKPPTAAGLKSDKLPLLKQKPFDKKSDL